MLQILPATPPVCSTLIRHSLLERYTSVDVLTDTNALYKGRKQGAGKNVNLVFVRADIGDVTLANVARTFYTYSMTIAEKFDDTGQIQDDLEVFAADVVTFLAGNNFHTKTNPTLFDDEITRTDYSFSILPKSITFSREPVASSGENSVVIEFVLETQLGDNIWEPRPGQQPPLFSLTGGPYLFDPLKSISVRTLPDTEYKRIDKPDV